jgi:3D (Asp-Asp-Asp) domain-containing protein
MLKIVKMISLSFMAAALCEQTSLSIPPYPLQAEVPVYQVTVSAYTSLPTCRGSRSGVMACSQRITPHDYGRVIALSKDLADKYDYGDKFNLLTNGHFRVVSFYDRMGKNRGKHVDLLLPSVRSCMKFGRNPGVLIPLGKS